MEQINYIFPSSPYPEGIEWPGSPMGISNTITRIKARTAIHDKTIDKEERKRDKLVTTAINHLKNHPKERHYQHDVIIHGVRVRAHTNKDHLYDFWVDNWYSPEEWLELTGLQPPEKPRVEVYALGDVAGELEAAYYSRETNTVIFFNTSYYGQLKSWVLGAVGRILAEECGIHSLHAACVGKGQKGVLYIAPTGSGKSTSSYGLMDYPGTRFHSDDWVYVRYTVQLKDGRRVCPVRILGSGVQEVQGYRVFRWLEEHQKDEHAVVSGIALNDEKLTFSLRDVDLAQPLQAYAYTSEKVFYLRSNLVANFPRAAYEIIHSKFENCPDITPEFMYADRPHIDEVVDDLLQHSEPKVRDYFIAMPRPLLAHLVARMFVFDNARTMLDIVRVFPKERCFTNPMEPLKIDQVFLLKRQPSDHVILSHLTPDTFIHRLMIGETPDGKREIAYNAYRAVDDQEEMAYVRELEKELAARRAQEPNLTLYQLYQSKTDVPDTLYQEMELFSTLYRTSHCYELNAVLQQDPQVRGRREAVLLTMRLLAQVIDHSPENLVLTLDNYRLYLEGVANAASRVSTLGL